MDTIHSILIFFDPWLIAPFRWPLSALAGYFLGTGLLALQCVIVGDISATAVAFVNRDYLRKIQQKMEHNHSLSEKALMAGDKESYKAINRQGLEAFGYSFSIGAAIFCVSIWPMPFFLAWMNLRFAEAPLELPTSLPLLGGKSVHYFTSFLLLYIAVRIIYGMSMSRVAWYNSFKAHITGIGKAKKTTES